MKKVLGIAYLLVVMSTCIVMLASLGRARAFPLPDASLSPDVSTPPGKYHPMTNPFPTAARGCSCHPPLPHRGGGGGAFLNAHTATLECSVCHLLASPSSRIVRAEGGRAGLEGAPEAGQNHALPPLWRFLPRRGEGCRSCHQRGASFPYRELGYEPQRQDELQTLPQPLILDQSSPWVIPAF